MRCLIFLIELGFFALAMTQQTLDNNPNRWWFVVTPMQSSPLPSVTPWLLPGQPSVRRDDYTYTPGIGGHKVHNRAATWHEARRVCEDEGGHLAIINSIAESYAIGDLFKKAEGIVGATGPHTDSAFIGFHDLFQEGEYLTIHSQSLAKAGFTGWSLGQPDNTGNAEDCGSVHKNGGLNDLACDKKYAFVCELPG